MDEKKTEKNFMTEWFDNSRSGNSATSGTISKKKCQKNNRLRDLVVQKANLFQKLEKNDV